MSVLAAILALALAGALALAVHWRKQQPLTEERFRALLEQSEARYRDLVENAPIGMYRTTPGGRILMANPALLRMLGYRSFEELAARNLESDGFHASYKRQDFKARLEREGELLAVEALWTARDGRTIAVRESARAVRGENGAVLYYEGTLEDVTGRKCAEAALAEAKSKLEAVIRQSPLAIITTSLDGRVTSWNPSAAKIFGWTEDELLGRTLPIIRGEREFRRGLEACRAGNLVRDAARIAVRKDGSEIEVSFWTATMRDAAGTTTGLVGFIADNTERNLHEARIRETEQRYRDLFENANDIIFSIDLEGNYTSMNKAGVQVSGYTRAELLQMNIADLLEPGQIGFARQKIQEKLAGAPSRPFELACRTKDGRPLQLEIAGRLVFRDGCPAGIQGIARDVTERKQWARRLEQYAEELTRKNEDLSAALAAAREATEAKSRFLANMSHEIRTPMNGVVGMTELLLATPLGAEQREYCEAVRSSAEALLVVINDILDISKIEAGKLDLDCAPFDLRRTVEGVVALLRPLAQRKHLALSFSIDPCMPGEVLGDEARIRQVLTNLAGNAVKFTENGEVRLLASVENEPGPGVRLVCTVEDTGIGIAPEHAPRLFHSFTQADTSTTRKYGGTGLGLAISKQLVEIMGGSIGFESRPGHGSKFWFRVTLAKPPGERAVSDPRDVISSPDGRVHNRNARILLAEDNEVNRRIALRMLENAGYQADAVPNGRRAVAEALTGRYDLVLMDVHMPEMDGFEATAEIRRNEGPSRHTPVIAMTARAMTGDRERCLGAGMDDYISKPVHMEELEGVIERWLRSLAGDRSQETEDRRQKPAGLPASGPTPCACGPRPGVRHEPAP